MSDVHNATALQPYSGRYQLIPLTGPTELLKGKPGGKQPAVSNWRLIRPLELDAAADHMAMAKNVGVRLSPTDLVLDIDPRNGGDASLVRLSADVGIDFDDRPFVTTGSGGRHIYMTKPADFIVAGKLAGYEGIDIKTQGGFVVAAGSIHANGKAYRWNDDPLAMPLSSVRAAPQALLELLKRSDTGSDVEPGQFDAEQLVSMLARLDATDFQDELKWRELMMASHHATGGAGLDAFLAWSLSDARYAGNDDDIRMRWNSLNAKRNSITVGTLFKSLIDAGHRDVVNAMTAVSDFEGVVEESHEVSEAISTPNRQTDIAERFVWVADAELFVRCADTKRFSERQFRSLYAGAWKEGDIVTAIWRDKLPMRKFESIVYLPWEGEVVANTHGGQSYNLWRDCSVEPKPGNVDTFLQHMAYLFSDEAERDHAIDYLALLVRKPAVKINFAMLVKGVQGTGKSALGTLIARMIGEGNVARPTNSVVVEKYTDWQVGAQFAIIEELMALGRQEVANRLKPAITDDYLSIRPMYGKVYTVPNRLNFLCFTNHDDALPIEKGDRRMFVLFSPAQPANEAYYKKLFAYLDGDGPAHVAHWLGERDVKLNPKGVAPMTMGKAEMRSLSMGDAEQHLTDLLEARGSPFDFGLVRLDDVIAAVPERAARQARNLRNRIIKWLRDDAGAIMHGRYTKGDRPAFQLWSIDDHDRWAGLGAAARMDAYVERYPRM